MTNDQRQDSARTGGDLARRVRRRRTALGLSQEQVADQARTDPGYVDCLEHTPIALTAGALIRLADALETSLAGRLTVVPVNYVMHGNAPVFRTAATTAVGRHGAGPVAFEVDRIDDGMHEGWSILVSGSARQATGSELGRLRTELSLASWAGGRREITW